MAKAAPQVQILSSPLFDMDLGLLPSAFPWPDPIPDLVPNEQPQYFGQSNVEAMSAILPPDTYCGPTILELGSWLGTSMKWMLGRYPNANGICIDRWYGQDQLDAIRKEGDPYMTVAKQPDLVYQQFVVNMLEFKSRLVAVREDSLRGLRRVYDMGVKPDIIYIDADHGRDGAYNDIATTVELFPDAFVFGDDIQYEGVQQAVDRAAKKYGFEYGWNNMTWYFNRNLWWKESRW